MTDEPLGRPERKVVAIDCHVDDPSGHAPLQLADLSLGGGFVKGQADVRRDDRILVTFSLDGHELQCAARVAHVQPSRGFGFAFFQDELPEEARLALERFIDGDA
jgi:PilZ domain